MGWLVGWILEALIEKLQEATGEFMMFVGGLFSDFIPSINYFKEKMFGATTYENLLNIIKTVAIIFLIFLIVFTVIKVGFSNFIEVKSTIIGTLVRGVIATLLIVFSTSLFSFVIDDVALPLWQELGLDYSVETIMKNSSLAVLNTTELTESNSPTMDTFITRDGERIIVDRIGTKQEFDSFEDFINGIMTDEGLANVIYQLSINISFNDSMEDKFTEGERNQIFQAAASSCNLLDVAGNVFSSTGAAGDINPAYGISTLLKLLLQLILNIVLIYLFLKLCVELVQHYVMMCTLVIFSPFFMTFFASEDTTLVFRSYIKMFCTETGLLIANKLWIVMSAVVVSHMTSGGLVSCFAIIAFMRIGSMLNNIAKNLNLTTSGMGSSLLDSIMITGGTLMMAGSRLKSGTGKLATNIGGATGSMGLVSAGNALTGRGLAPDDIAKASASSFGGSLRDKITSGNNGSSNLTNSMKNNLDNMIRQGGFFKNNAAVNQLNHLNEKGKREMFNHMTSTGTLKPLAEAMQKNGNSMKVTGFSQKGFEVDFLGKDGSKLRSGTITDFSSDGAMRFETSNGDSKFINFDKPNISPEQEPIGFSSKEAPDGMTEAELKSGILMSDVLPEKFTSDMNGNKIPDKDTDWSNYRFASDGKNNTWNVQQKTSDGVSEKWSNIAQVEIGKGKGSGVGGVYNAGNSISYTSSVLSNPKKGEAYIPTSDILSGNKYPETQGINTSNGLLTNEQYLTSQFAHEGEKYSGNGAAISENSSMQITASNEGAFASLGYHDVNNMSLSEDGMRADFNYKNSLGEDCRGAMLLHCDNTAVARNELENPTFVQGNVMTGSWDIGQVKEKKDSNGKIRGTLTEEDRSLRSNSKKNNGNNSFNRPNFSSPHLKGTDLQKNNFNQPHFNKPSVPTEQNVQFANNNTLNLNNNITSQGQYIRESKSSDKNKSKPANKKANDNRKKDNSNNDNVNK